ncbi:hypothetical protein ACQ4PT_025660 [Festuca glaucescens]
MLFNGLMWRLALAKLHALLSAVLLCAQPLSGEHLRAAHRAAERDLARAVEEGDRPVAADLRLLLALFAVRDGRFDDALERYAEVALEDPTDSRPRELAFLLCGVAGRPGRDELKRFGRGTVDVAEPRPLKDELTVAAVLGGALPDYAEVESMPLLAKRITRLAVFCAWRRADAGLAAAQRDKETSVVKRIQVWVVRVLLYAGERSVFNQMDHQQAEIEGNWRCGHAEDV